VIIFLFHDFIANYEEEFLLEKYGMEYETYKKRTAKWMPKIGPGR
jgi:protein-S-isoprenylcysteine O-methyltransferase Ste14